MSEYTVDGRSGCIRAPDGTYVSAEDACRLLNATGEATDEQIDAVAKLYNQGAWDLLSTEQKEKQRLAIRAALQEGE